MASSLSSSAFTGDRWMIEIGEHCLPIRVIETNSPIVCWHWLGSRATKTICQNLRIDSVHPNWIDKHGRQHTAASLVQLTLASSCMYLNDSQLTSAVAVRRVRLMMFTENTRKCYQAPFPIFLADACGFKDRAFYWYSHSIMVLNFPSIVHQVICSIDRLSLIPQQDPQ